MAKRKAQGKIPITTSITQEMYHDCKSKGIGWQFLIIRGYNSLDGFEKLQERANEAERQAENFRRIVSNMRQRQAELEAEIANLKKKEEQ